MMLHLLTGPRHLREVFGCGEAFSHFYRLNTVYPDKTMTFKAHSFTFKVFCSQHL